MAYRLHRLVGLLAVASALTGVIAQPASAYLFWKTPNFSGAPVRGDEPGIGLPLPGATPAELQAHLLWNMRAGLNVAALQCQFSPPLMAVRNYNAILSQHAKELNAAYTAIAGYFKRTGGKTWQKQADAYTTRTYNGFSTLHAQLGFCDTAAAIGREALSRPRGELHLTATTRMQEFRNSLIPIRDMIFAVGALSPRVLPPFDPKCWDRKDTLKKKCAAQMPAATTASLPYTL